MMDGVVSWSVMMVIVGVGVVVMLSVIVMLLGGGLGPMMGGPHDYKKEVGPDEW